MNEMVEILKARRVLTQDQVDRREIVKDIERGPFGHASHRHQGESRS
jgi:hypothetical protein